MRGKQASQRASERDSQPMVIFPPAPYAFNTRITPDLFLSITTALFSARGISLELYSELLARSNTCAKKLGVDASRKVNRVFCPLLEDCDDVSLLTSTRHRKYAVLICLYCGGLVLAGRAGGRVWCASVGQHWDDGE